MTKHEFLYALREKLSTLPPEDVEERLAFYSEIIDDRIEDGLTETESVKQIGSVDEIATEIVSKIPLTRIVKNEIKKKRGLKAWEIILLVIGAPIWLSLIIAAFSIILSLYVSAWAIIASLWAVFGALVCGGVGLIPIGVILAAQCAIPTGIAFIGIGLFAVGLSIFFFFGCKYTTVGASLLTKKIFLEIKKCFIRKENV